MAPMSVPRTRRWRGMSPLLLELERKLGQAAGMRWKRVQERFVASESSQGQGYTATPLLHDAGVTLRNSLQLLTLCAVADVSAETLLCAEHTDAELRTFLHHCQLWETRSSFRPHSLLSTCRLLVQLFMILSYSLGFLQTGIIK